MAVAAIVTVLDDVALWLKARGWGCGRGVVMLDDLRADGEVFRQ